MFILFILKKYVHIINWLFLLYYIFCYILNYNLFFTNYIHTFITLLTKNIIIIMINLYFKFTFLACYCVFVLIKKLNFYFNIYFLTLMLLTFLHQTYITILLLTYKTFIIIFLYHTNTIILRTISYWIHNIKVILLFYTYLL